MSCRERERASWQFDGLNSCEAGIVRRLAVGSIARLCNKSELIGFAKMTTLTIDRYKVFRCLGMVERRRLSRIFSPCLDLSHGLSLEPTADRRVSSHIMTSTFNLAAGLALVSGGSAPSR